ncbi:hypothetical protein [Longimicrobium sp.]|uniref:hypothetical protein n=1 Tax=Longimicrobium sp. TaxID=2029185 RepID=UPI002B69E2B1|nr:hypothetical protein [Longimicrobium sp.]HSU17695.1 hypothetical protein [Longimicrobium sp.]
MSTPNNRALAEATAAGTVLQLTMVILGHWAPVIASLFAVLGMAISLVAGALYARMARPGIGQGAVGGAVAGGVCALIGIAVSFALGDVPAVVLAFGTVSSAVTGAIGGAAVAALTRRPATNS